MIVVSDGYIRVHNREIHDTLLRVHSTNTPSHSRYDLPTPASPRSVSNCLIGSPLVSMSAIMSSEAQYVNLILLVIHHIMDEMVFYINMLRSSVDLRIFGETYGRFFVFKNGYILDSLI